LKLAICRLKKKPNVYISTKKYVLRSISANVCKEGTAPVCKLKLYKYKKRYTFRTLGKKYTTPGFGHKTRYCLYTGANICTYRSPPVILNKAEPFNPKKYLSYINVRVCAYVLTVHESTAYSMYNGNNWLHAAPPPRRLIANKGRGRGCPHSTGKQCAAGKQTVYCTCHQYVARHRGGRSASSESTAYKVYCIKVLHISASVRTTIFNRHIGVNWLPLIPNTLKLSTGLSLIILNASGFYSFKVMRLILRVYTLIFFTAMSLIKLCASVFYSLRTTILLVCGVIPVYFLNLEVRKKYNLAVRKIIGKMSEPGERSGGGGPGKPYYISSNISMSFASESSIIYFGLSEYSWMNHVLDTFICYTLVQYITYVSSDMCRIMCPMCPLALCVSTTCLLVTISNCSSRYGE
jgi:hypothetical protein